MPELLLCFKIIRYYWSWTPCHYEVNQLLHIAALPTLIFLYKTFFSCFIFVFCLLVSDQLRQQFLSFFFHSSVSKIHLPSPEGREATDSHSTCLQRWEGGILSREEIEGYSHTHSDSARLFLYTVWLKKTKKAVGSTGISQNSPSSWHLMFLLEVLQK